MEETMKTLGELECFNLGVLKKRLGRCWEADIVCRNPKFENIVCYRIGAPGVPGRALGTILQLASVLAHRARLRRQKETHSPFVCFLFFLLLVLYFHYSLTSL